MIEFIAGFLVGGAICLVAFVAWANKNVGYLK